VSKHGLTWDEAYPVFILTDDHDDAQIELTPTERARVEEAEAEWEAVQQLLLVRLRESGNTRF